MTLPKRSLRTKLKVRAGQVNWRGLFREPSSSWSTIAGKEKWQRRARQRLGVRPVLCRFLSNELERSAVLIAPGFPLSHSPRFLIDLSHFARMLRAGEFYEQ